MGRPETGRTGARFGAPARRARNEPAAGDEPVDPDVVAEPYEPEVGLTGARFGGRTRKSRKERQAEKAQAENDERPRNRRRPLSPRTTSARRSRYRASSRSVPPTSPPSRSRRARTS